jgi:hypothetical protein
MMATAPHVLRTTNPIHAWLRSIRVAHVPGPTTSLLEEVARNLLDQFHSLGHQVQVIPDDSTDIILTTVPGGKVVNWRRAVQLAARQRFNLSHTPPVYTLVDISPGEFQALLECFETALAKESPDAADYDFPGLAPQAYRVLHKQGRRGGALLALQRLVQAQAKSLRVLLVIGDEHPEAAYHFDLVGAHPRSEAVDPPAFYEDIVLRMVTTVCTKEVTDHQVVEGSIPHHLWQSLCTLEEMSVAGRQLGKRNFFTEMVRIADVVQVPAVGDSVADQYSEGCFSTWDVNLGALVATVTGSARPVDKSNITEDDLAVIVGVRPDGSGALVRHVEGKRNSPPSTEAVEMIDMDRSLPRISLGPEWGIRASVPVARSKLHGHRGIAGFHPDYVEFAPLEPQYYHYLVSCGTGAQAVAIREAFARAEALLNPEDPRQLVFSVLPGHGTVIVEKWVPRTVPFQTIWEHMDAGFLRVEVGVPQGPMAYVPDRDGRMVLRAL